MHIQINCVLDTLYLVKAYDHRGVLKYEYKGVNPFYALGYAVAMKENEETISTVAVFFRSPLVKDFEFVTVDDLKNKCDGLEKS